MQLSAKQASALFANNEKLYGDLFVEVDGETIRHKQKLPVSEITSESLEDLKSTFDAERLTVKTYRRNGTSWKFENEIEINLGETIRKTSLNGFINDEEDNNDDYSKTPAPSFTTPAPSIPNNGNLALFQYIANEKGREVEDLKRRNRTLERDNEQFKNKINNLEMDLRKKDMEHEISLQQKDAEQKSSLSGIMEQVSKPEVMGALPSVIAALKGLTAPALPASGDLLSGVSDEGQRAALTEMNNFLKTSPEMTAKAYKVIDRASRNPGLIDKILKSTEKYD